MSTALRTDANSLAGAVSFKGTDNIKLTAAGAELLATPRAPTATEGANTTQVATTEFVTRAVSSAISNQGNQPSDAVPSMDGVGNPGISNLFSRGDHVHPQFTSASNAVPPSDSPTGSAGASSSFARADHSHPTGPANIGATGFVTLPGGLIMQWGFATFSSSGSSVIFPMNFQSSVFVVMATPASTSGNETCAVSGQTQSGFTGRSTNGVGCFWMAIGK